jgi:hypothetical protein
MKYRIAFSDIDGTLLNADREPSAPLIREVARLTAAGVPFILISSRMPPAMSWMQDMLGIPGLPLVAYNGGLVMVDGKVAHSEEIPLMIVRAVQECNRSLKLSVQLFYADEWYVESRDNYALREQNNTRVTPTVRKLAETAADWKKRNCGAHKIMVMGDPAGLDEITGFLERVFGTMLHLYRSKEDYLEIASRDISKRTGTEMVLAIKYPDLTLADCIAFGDNHNDVEMLKGVGLGVAVANAKAEVLAVADVTTAAAKSDGVALALAQYVK